MAESETKTPSAEAMRAADDIAISANRTAKRVRHGKSDTTEYRSWEKMRARCNNPRNPSYRRYSARGIKVCDEWLRSFTIFYKEVGDKPSPQHSLDRIDNDRGYEPGNVRWATQTEQQRNRDNNRRIEVDGISRTLQEWSEISGVQSGTIAFRLLTGRNAKEAIFAKRCGRRDLRPNNSEIVAGEPGEINRLISRITGMVRRNSIRNVPIENLRKVYALLDASSHTA